MHHCRNARQEPLLAGRQLSLNLAHAPWKLAAKQAGFTCDEIWGGCRKAVPGLRVIVGSFKPLERLSQWPVQTDY
jgi:hypothetical protein